MAGNVSSEKATLRQEAESRRRALTPEMVQRLGDEVQRHLIALPLLSDRALRAVAVYDAQSFEPSLALLVRELTARGTECVYPRIIKGSRELAFHVPGIAWARGPLGIREPTIGSDVRAIWDIDVFLVPGVAFASDGRRLGRGAGYYDATLAKRRAQARTIGVTFDCCLVADVPTEPHDVRMDFVASESGVVSTCHR